MTSAHGAGSKTAATTAWVALGSNRGDRDGMLAFAVRALDEIDGVAVVECSPVYETDPVGPGEQSPYLNAVLSLTTSLSARDLLQRMHAIEARAGRTRGPDEPRWGARTLDLDLLYYGDERIDEPDLVVPHPRIAERAFVLVPLADLAPDRLDPWGQTVAERLRALVGRSGAGAGAHPAGIRLWERCSRIAP